MAADEYSSFSSLLHQNILLTTLSCEVVVAQLFLGKICFRSFFHYSELLTFLFKDKQVINDFEIFSFCCCTYEDLLNQV